MIKSAFWETVNYQDLPQWMRQNSKPRQWINKSDIKFFFGKSHDYRVEYTVIHGKLHITYSRSGHRIKIENLEAQIVTKKKEIELLEIGPRWLFYVGLIGLLFFGLGIILIIMWFYWKRGGKVQILTLQNDIKKLQNEIDREWQEWNGTLEALCDMYDDYWHDACWGDE